MIKNLLLNLIIYLFFQRVKINHKDFTYIFIKKYFSNKNRCKPIIKNYKHYTIVYYSKFLHYLFYLEFSKYKKKEKKLINICIDNQREFVYKKTLFKSKCLKIFEDFVSNCRKNNFNSNILIYGKKGTGKSSIIFSDIISKYSNIFYFTKFPNHLKYENDSVYIFDFEISKKNIDSIIDKKTFKNNVINIFIMNEILNIHNCVVLKFNRLNYKQIFLYLESLFGKFNKSDMDIDPNIKYDYLTLNKHILLYNFNIYKCVKNFENEYKVDILSSDEEQNFIL